MVMSYHNEMLCNAAVDADAAVEGCAWTSMTSCERPGGTVLPASTHMKKMRERALNVAVWCVGMNADTFNLLVSHW